MSTTPTPARPALRLVGERPVLVTWVLLVVATCLTTWVFTAHGFDRHWALLATFVVAAWKVRLVLTDFVELRSAPLVGRLVFEGWAVVVPLVVIVLAW